MSKSISMHKSNKGFFGDLLGSVLSPIGTLLGGKVGGPVGAAAGGFLGDKAAGLARRIPFKKGGIVDPEMMKMKKGGKTKKSGLGPRPKTKGPAMDAYMAKLRNRRK